MLAIPKMAPTTAPKRMKYNQPSTIQISTACPAPPPSRPTSAARVAILCTSGLKLTSSSGAWRMRKVARSRNGNPKPSLDPASAEMISLRARGTYLSANGPLAMAWERTGSVEVTSEPMTMAVSVVSFGIMSLIQPVVQSHMIVMTGIKRRIMSFQRCQGYFAGSW
jgi:hypothetical protein